MITKKRPKCLDEAATKKLIAGVARAELDECPRSYLKAVRVTLLGLGYDPQWVEGDFRDALEAEYLD